jgi:hypothetical protein
MWALDSGNRDRRGRLRWLAGLSFEHAAHYVVLEDCVAAVEAATARRDHLEADIEAALSDWSLTRRCSQTICPSATTTKTDAGLTSASWLGGRVRHPSRSQQAPGRNCSARQTGPPSESFAPLMIRALARLDNSLRQA